MYGQAFVERRSNNWGRIEGTPTPLGAVWVDQGNACNFALYSRYATGVTLLLYSPQDVVIPVLSFPMNYLKNKTGRVWHCRIPASQVPEGGYYGYRVTGPLDPDRGHYFDPDKVLLDPHARGVFFPENFSRELARSEGSNDGSAPLGLIPRKEESFDWGGDRRPLHGHDTVIYELHVKGFTKLDGQISPEKRGTFAGLAEKIPYLQELGVTVLELLPVHQYDPQEGNYWGYMTLNFFTPHVSYGKEAGAPDAVLREFREMVKAFHAAGIEVVLDVVYNHTAEGDQRGPTYSFRGIDNRSYYLMSADGKEYRNDAGTGNVLDSSNQGVQRMIVDSLNYWTHEMRVDGFRFDLATIFTRDREGRVNLDDPPIISAISGLEFYAPIRLIAEAWDPLSYQLGHDFPGITWLQWNGRFRDEVRAFVRGDRGRVASFMSSLYGSDDLFPDNLADAYHAYQSVNFITAHDGFCLYDLVAYNEKHNLANGHNNEDGADYNLSWNCGWEGDEGAPPEVLELRRRQVKNFCCILFLSNGTPMFRAGDEFMNTQHGNNNPYNQDNETSWLDWNLLEKNREIFRFFKEMISFRKAHPSLGRSRFWRDDVSWYGASGGVDYGDDSHAVAFCLRGASQRDCDIYVMINAYWEDLPFIVQEKKPGEWRRVVDTSLPSPEDIVDQNGPTVLSSRKYLVRARSVVVLVGAVPV
ncbi:isoamylase [Geomonas sp. RF6]|uniref:glycogen debranching protein n=1 Tax=Geomonas sp. RF6 TaxID=2897342 RepID=UPI001E4D95A7|nr:isoamylase [Geomonas sp. RF6]UFS69942.1 isoamylase [Geomonas sp. RF6]